jgi:hypothetical protein
MLTIVEEVYNGGRDLIPNWKLLHNAKRAARQGGVEGLRRYYENLIRVPSTRATWVRERLHAHGRRTLESEYERFVAAYRTRRFVKFRLAMAAWLTPTRRTA